MKTNNTLKALLFLNILICIGFSAKTTYISGTKKLFVPPNSDPKNYFPGGVDKGSLIVKDDKIYLFGGAALSSSMFGYSNQLWEYSISTQKWRHISGSFKGDNLYEGGNLPPSSFGVATVLSKDQKSFYAFGGISTYGNGAIMYNMVWEFFFANESWVIRSGSKQPNPPVDYNTPNIAPLAHHSMVLSDDGNSFYVFGGVNLYTDFYGHAENTLWKYDLISDNWSILFNSSNIDGDFTRGIPAARVGTNLYLSSKRNKLYMFGGSFWKGYYGSGDYLADVWEFDLSTNKFKFIGGSKQKDGYNNYNNNIVGGTSYYTGVMSNNQDSFYIALGNQMDAATNDIWKYDLQTNKFQFVAGDKTWNAPANYSKPYPGSTGGALAGNVGEAIYFFGGRGFVDLPKSGVLSDLWKIQL
eukprot:TRINITY_DN12058_c0_g1_i1.p1 TRINITY_DN12058_c0_g1~~TRINITY_DN12058_c0_g1_i1.p1  ORF type:complete len:412 (-),score=80.88 TRINITY_DN12058_c0_g1_i1:39-1274(-)